MIPRTLEPEVMDTEEDADDYDAMDHSKVNLAFVEDWLQLNPERDEGEILDVGTGTALIPIELCRQSSLAQVTAIDLGESMLLRAAENVQRAGLSERIRLLWRDAKELTFADGEFSGVISNSIIHHIPEPISCLVEMWRVLGASGMLFVRDLVRPTSIEEIERLVQFYAGRESPRQQQLFRQSFHAALTISEITELAKKAGIAKCEVTLTSDRHWTLVGRKE